MVRTRQAKIDGIARTIPPLEVDDPSGAARVLVLGWGSTYGPIGAACRRVRAQGRRGRPGAPAAPQPVPGQPRRRAARYDRVLVPEMNLGQLALLLRGRYLVDAIAYNQVRGLPFKAEELEGVIEDVIASV